MLLLNVPFSRFPQVLSQLVLLLEPLRLLPRFVTLEITRAPLLAGVGCPAE